MHRSAPARRCPACKGKGTTLGQAAPLLIAFGLPCALGLAESGLGRTPHRPAGESALMGGQITPIACLLACKCCAYATGWKVNSLRIRN